MSLFLLRNWTNEVKVQIYEVRKQVQSFKQLSKRFGVDFWG
ncbi:hypothetical protein SMSK321_0726 [Streptococcus mitis SK321]|nr:hypothetical protein SMSK321_0726 [Streptococcus mitis SK321]